MKGQEVKSNSMKEIINQELLRRLKLKNTEI